MPSKPRSRKREIAVKFSQSRHGAPLRVREPANVFPLLPAEEEKLVLNDWTTKAVTEVVETQRWSDRGEERARIEFVVSHELESAAVKLVAAAARDETDLRAGVAPILGREI